MVNSRLKILKNKKEIQIKQLRQELAQLLEAGNTPKIEFGWKRRQWLPMNSLASTVNSLLFFRCYRVSKELKPNTIYKLNGFSIRPSKSVYRVSPHKHGISFNNKTTFAPVHEVDYQIDSQHFRIRDRQAFTDIVDKHTDLLDIIGFLRVINGDNLDTQTPMATAPAPAGERSKDMVFLHVQLEDGETARVYLWDKITAAFPSRWNDSKTKPSVILLTTLNSKTLGGVVTLSSTASTRLFFDSDIIETEKLLSSSSAAVTKVETLTLKEIHKFLENESPQVASFICTATIMDVMEEYGWYFISCTACKWQLERSETTFICPNYKCKKPNTVGLIRLGSFKN
ncbi:unnamed protein product, partial [Brassica oleracea]